MKALRLSTSILLCITCVPYAAADDAVIGTPEERTQCAKSMGLSDLADTGSYSLRIDNCIRQLRQAEQTIDRTQRLQLRAESVLDRITRNSKAYIHREIEQAPTPQQRSDRLRQLLNAENTYRKLEQNRPSLRESVLERTNRRLTELQYTPYVPVTSESSYDRQITTTRPSRRRIKENAYDFTRQTRIESADAYQKILNDALAACAHISNNFQRGNCVRSALRKAGAQ